MPGRRSRAGCPPGSRSTFGRGLLALVLVAACSVGTPSPTRDAGGAVAPSSSTVVPATSATTLSTSTSLPGDGSDSSCAPRGDSPGASGVGDPVLPLMGNGGYDVSHYDLRFLIDPARNHLDALVTIDAVATQRLTSFNLDFSGPTISEVHVGERPAGHCREDGELVVVPESFIADGDHFTVSVAYAGSPSGVMRPGVRGTEGWTHHSDEQVTLGGLWGAEAAYMPVNATNLDKATYGMEVTVPQPLAVVANGTLDGVNEPMSSRPTYGSPTFLRRQAASSSPPGGSRWRRRMVQTASDI